MKIYICGKVTGVPWHKCLAKFNRAQEELELAGYVGTNPINIVLDQHASWNEAMKKCIAAMVHCDALLVLPCAKSSKGAQVEQDLAKTLQIPIFKSVKEINR